MVSVESCLLEIRFFFVWRQNNSEDAKFLPALERAAELFLSCQRLVRRLCSRQSLRSCCRRLLVPSRSRRQSADLVDSASAFCSSFELHGPLRTSRATGVGSMPLMVFHVMTTKSRQREVRITSSAGRHYKQLNSVFFFALLVG